MARSRRIGSIGANRADQLGRRRSRSSVLRGIELDAWAASTIRSRRWARRTHAVDSVGGQLVGLCDGPIGPSP
jgi:hypothetical protein